MVKEVYKNIYTFKVVLPKSPLKATNIYIIKDRDKNLVLDTGYHTQETLDSMLAGLADLGLEMSDTDLFISHMHADHSGLASNFKSAGCKVYASAADGKIINDAANGSYWQLLYKLLDYFNVTGGEIMLEDHPGYLFQAPDEVDMDIVAPGDIIRTGEYEFEVMDLKGHTPGHIGLYERKHKIFFCGDTILETITPNITFWGFEEGDALNTYMNTLLGLRNMDFDHVFSTHRDPVLDYIKRIDEIIDHHILRLQEILDAMEPGVEYTIRDLSPRITWRIKADSWDDFPPAQKFFASGETMAHVFHMVKRGQVYMDEREGVLYFTKLDDKYDPSWLKRV